MASATDTFAHAFIATLVGCIILSSLFSRGFSSSMAMAIMSFSLYLDRFFSLMRHGMSRHCRRKDERKHCKYADEAPHESSIARS